VASRVSGSLQVTLPSTERCVLGVMGFSEELLGACAPMLESVAVLERLPSDVDRSWRSDAYAAILIALREPLAEGIADLCAARRSNPLVPFIVLAANVDANLAAELLKLGADDFLLMPPAPEALLHKVRRLLGEALGPAFELPELAAFKPRDFDQNQRRCFRVHVPPDFPVASTFPGPIERPLEVKDLSIETEVGPGGMQIAADRATARRLPFDQWNRRREIELNVQLPTGSPIVARARLVPGLRHSADGSIRFAVEYWVTRPAEKERFRRYWVEAQRRLRRARK
jgi:CheY-like chemotaxis protein